MFECLASVVGFSRNWEGILKADVYGAEKSNHGLNMSTLLLIGFAVAIVVGTLLDISQQFHLSVFETLYGLAVCIFAIVIGGKVERALEKEYGGNWAVFIAIVVAGAIAYGLTSFIR